MINGVEYPWEDIKIYFDGVPFVDIKSIEYKDAEESEYLFGAGSYPIGLGIGNKTAEGKLVIGRAEFQKLLDLCGGNYWLLVLPQILIAYAEKAVVNALIEREYKALNRDILKNVKIVDRSYTHAQNDKESVVELSFIYQPAISQSGPAQPLSKDAGRVGA
ncbi:hypothetical protein ES703_04178 [subsurface metagenome]|nr:hypothetical protein [bacterium]